MLYGGEMPKYAPPRADGLKPWLVTRTEWGRTETRIVFAATRAGAEYELKGRQRFVSARARRATPEDMANENQQWPA